MVQEKNYTIELAILEKQLTTDNSLLWGKLTIYHLTDLQVYYDRLLAEVGSFLEESIGRERKVLKLISKVILKRNYYVSISFRISRSYYGGEDNYLARTGQGNRFSDDVY